jgi:hypothetical protein
VHRAERYNSLAKRGILLRCYHASRHSRGCARRVRAACAHARARCWAGAQLQGPWRRLARALTRLSAQARAFAAGDKAGGVLSEFAKSVKSGLERCAAAWRVPSRRSPAPQRSRARSRAARHAHATPVRHHVRRRRAHRRCVAPAACVAAAATDAAAAQQPGAEKVAGGAEEKHQQPGREVRSRRGARCGPIAAR